MQRFREITHAPDILLANLHFFTLKFLLTILFSFHLLHTSAGEIANFSGEVQFSASQLRFNPHT